MEGPTWDTSGNVSNTPSSSFRVGVQKVLEGATRSSAIVRWDVSVDQSYPVTYNIVATDLTGSINKILNVPFERNPDWSRDPVNNSTNQFYLFGLTIGPLYNIKMLEKININAHYINN